MRDLKLKLLEIVSKIDAELLEFSIQCNPFFEWSNWNDLAGLKEEINNLLENLNSTEVLKLIQPPNSIQGKFEVLANIIGLKQELAGVIFEEPGHETEEDQIHRYFDLIYRNFLSGQEVSTNINVLLIIINSFGLILNPIHLLWLWRLFEINQSTLFNLYIFFISMLCSRPQSK